MLSLSLKMEDAYALILTKASLAASVPQDSTELQMRTKTLSAC